MIYKELKEFDDSKQSLQVLHIVIKSQDALVKQKEYFETCI
jgi:hypothetical protein